MKGNYQGVILAAFFAVLAGVGLAEAVNERGDHYAKPTYQADGDPQGRHLFAVSCPYSAWTLVVSSDSARRSALFQGVQANSAAGVCLSSSAATGSCSDTTAGPEVWPLGGLTDYTTSEWYCRSRDTNTDKIKGYTTRHSRDTLLPGE